MYGDIIEFGNYPRSRVHDEATLSLLMEVQGDEASINGTRYLRYQEAWYRYEPLRFVVIDDEDEESIDLVSVECIDGVIFDDAIAPFYSRSYIRKWLHEDFKNMAFSAIEQERIEAIDLPDAGDLNGLPRSNEESPLTDFASAHTHYDTYWTCETRSGWTGSFQDYDDRPPVVAVVEAVGPYPADVNIHTSWSLRDPRPVRVALSIRK